MPNDPTPPGAAAARPAVSAVIIFLDAERFLAEAVESVLAQQFTDWELLLVDDGSTDRGAEVARGYAACHPGRIRYLAHPGGGNRGMSASRNLGVRHAAADLIAFLDADDVWLPEKLAVQAALLERHPEAAMVYGATRLWYSWTGRPEDQGRDRLRQLGVAPGTVVRAPALAPVYLTRRGLPPSTCGVLIRRRAFDEVGGFEESFRGLFEDQVFFYKMAFRHAVLVEGGSWDLYRQHPHSHCHVAEAAGVYRDDGLSEPHRVFLEWLAAYSRQHGLDTPAVRQALAEQLRPYRHPRRHQVHERLRALRRALGWASGRARGLARRPLAGLRRRARAAKQPA